MNKKQKKKFQKALYLLMMFVAIMTTSAIGVYHLMTLVIKTKIIAIIVAGIFFCLMILGTTKYKRVM